MLSDVSYWCVYKSVSIAIPICLTYKCIVCVHVHVHVCVCITTTQVRIQHPIMFLHAASQSIFPLRGNRYSDFYLPLISFACPCDSHKWNHIEYNLLCLASFHAT